MLILSGLPFSTWSADEEECEAESSECTDSEMPDQPGRMQSLAGPEQVENRLDIDSNQVTSMLPGELARGYFNWKDRIKKEHGLDIGGDYSFAYLKASDSPGEDDAFSGMYRFFGSWEATGNGKRQFGCADLENRTPPCLWQLCRAGQPGF